MGLLTDYVDNMDLIHSLHSHAVRSLGINNAIRFSRIRFMLCML